MSPISIKPVTITSSTSAIILYHYTYFTMPKFLYDYFTLIGYCVGCYRIFAVNCTRERCTRPWTQKSLANATKHSVSFYPYLSVTIWILNTNVSLECAIRVPPEICLKPIKELVWVGHTESAKCRQYKTIWYYELDFSKWKSSSNVMVVIQQ